MLLMHCSFLWYLSCHTSKDRNIKWVNTNMTFPKIKIIFKCMQNPFSVLCFIFTSACSCNWPFLRSLNFSLVCSGSLAFIQTCRVRLVEFGRFWQARALRVLKRNLGVWTGADNETVWIPRGARCGEKCLTPTSLFHWSDYNTILMYSACA